MGTCISKCCLNSNSNSLPPPQDKLVISQLQSPLPPPTSSSSTSASSSLLSSSSTTTATTTTTASSCSPSSNIATTPLKPKPYTNDFLLSCAKENPHIIILDPHKFGVATNPKKPASRPINQCNSVRLTVKRDRSSSPLRPIARQKNFRSEVRPEINAKPSRTLSSPNNVHKNWSRMAGRNEIRPPPQSPCNSLSRANSKEISNKDRPEIVEDIDNPLISMECFIFL